MMHRSENMHTDLHRIRKNAMLSVGLVLILLSALILLQIYRQNSKATAINTNSAAGIVTTPKPKQIRVDSLKINAPIVELGLNADRTLEVPSVASDVGWYRNSPTPGAVGASILVGHLDSVRGRAVFYDLKNIKVGDMIEIEREDGSIEAFKVDFFDVYNQDNFPTEKVYGNIDFEGLRLITCSGKYNYVHGRYTDNLVVYASKI
jgi:sortase (surface protein transpeptidase)